MAKQFQLGSLPISIDYLELTYAFQNGCDWYIEQQEYHQVHTREVKVFLLAHIAEYSGTLYLPLFGSLFSVSCGIGTILGWILMALLPEDRLERLCAFSSQSSVIHIVNKQEE